ncbi:MAG: hypothetical protein WCR42_08265 [bacterium]
MKTINILLLLASIFILNACTFGIEPIKNESKDLIGNWINPLNVDTLICRFERTTALQDTAYGFSIQSDKVFIERKNSGWCGTPPIAYENYKGTWSENDSVLSITVGYWGGMADYKWKIISVDDKYLTVYKIKEEFIQKEE